MALVKTTLAGAVTAGATQITLTSSTNIANKMLVRVDDEWMRVTDVTLAPTVSVVRGYSNGFTSSAAVAHGILAGVSYGIPADFSQPTGIAGADTYSYGASGAITVPLVVYWDCYTHAPPQTPPSLRPQASPIQAQAPRPPPALGREEATGAEGRRLVGLVQVVPK